LPYIDGKRVSAEEWQARYSNAQAFHTGPNGDNPATAPVINEETGAPESKPKAKAGGKRSQRSEKAAKAAIADALGVKTDSPALADIDVSGLDAPAATEDE
jgi:high-affinity K+ transport system ATPase subunit B